MRVRSTDRAVCPAWRGGSFRRVLGSARDNSGGTPRVVSASREIAAGPERIFELIADPAQQPRWDGNDNLAWALARQRVRGTSSDASAGSTTTGTSYTSIGTITAAGSYGFGPLLLASSSYGPGAATFVLPGTTDLDVVSNGSSTTRIQMSGLPASPDSISFQNASNGIAQTTVRACSGNKSNCTVNISQYVTSDGGRTWTLS